MPMKGRFPIRRTLEYLQKGEVVFNNSVKIMTVNYNTHGDLSEGARSEKQHHHLYICKPVHKNTVMINCSKIPKEFRPQQIWDLVCEYVIILYYVKTSIKV